MSQRASIFECFTDLLPKHAAMKNGAVDVRTSRTTRSSSRAGLKQRRGVGKSKLKLNGVVKNTGHSGGSITDHSSVTTEPASPEKRLCQLIDKLSRRTSLEKSPVKRRNSIIFNEPAAKKIKVEEDGTDAACEDSEPECAFEIMESDPEVSDSHRLFTLAVAKIMNLEDEIERLSRRCRMCRVEFTDEAVRTYTGLPNLEVFHTVYEKIKPMVLKIRCRKDRSLVVRVRRKYRRIRGEFVRMKRLNLKDELMIALMHAKHDYDIRDTASRYCISVGHCNFIISFWMSFLPFELEKALLSISHLLPESRWSRVPEYKGPPDPAPIREEVPSPTPVLQSSWTATPKSNGLRLVLRNPNSRIPPVSDSPELRKLLSSSSEHNLIHDAVFRARANYLCKSCCLTHECGLDLLEHCHNQFGKDYQPLFDQLSELMDMIDDNNRDAQELKCCVCDETRETLSSFLVHMHEHMRTSEIKCVKCNKFFKKEVYDDHMEEVHSKRTLKFFCTVCCIVLESKEVFDKHNEQHRSALKLNGTTMTISESGQVTIQGRKLAKLAPKPTIPPKVTIPTNSPSQAVSALQSSGSKSTSEKSDSKSDNSAEKSRQKLSRIRHNCDQCNKVFYSKSGLDLHKIVHNVTSEERIQCPHCPRTFAHKITLKVHMTQHTGEKPHKCSYCDKSFFRKNDLFNHERIHTGEKPYSCQYCGSKFAHSCSLAAHVRQSCHKVPSKCEICGFVAKVRGEFEAHMKTHVSECNFQCNLCGKNFLTRQHLEQHQSIHRHKYSCRHCKAQFHSMKDLHSHIRLHLDKAAKPKVKPASTPRSVPVKDHAPNQCDQCMKWFTRRSDLKRHQKRVHNVVTMKPLRKSRGESPENGTIPGNADRDIPRNVDGESPGNLLEEDWENVADVDDIVDGVMINPLVIDE